MLPFLLTAVNEVFSSIFFLFGYISNTNSFPQPLSAEEETKFMELYKNGNEEARNTLIERNLRLVAHIVKKYSTFGNDCDDLISIGTIGLIKAITTFDMSKGTRLATYAARCIENAILSLRKHWGTYIATICRIKRYQPDRLLFKVYGGINNYKLKSPLTMFGIAHIIKLMQRMQVLDLV